MYIPFDELPDDSRIWIYQADRSFAEAEQKLIRDSLQSFCEQWTAHGHSLRTSYIIDRNQFVVLGVDERVGDASGCSIDGSVRVLKSLQVQTGIDFLDRSMVPFIVNGVLQRIPVRELKQSFMAGILGPGTLTFNLLAPAKGVWKREWVLPAEKTWMAQYLPKTTAT